MLNLPLHNSNRTMQLLNKTCVKGVPGIGSESPVAYLKFFIDGWTWYCSELDLETGEAFGKVISPMEPSGELGYFNILELSKLRGSVGHGVDRDRFFSPTNLKECQ